LPDVHAERNRQMESSLAGLTLLRPGIGVVKFFFRTEPSAFSNRFARGS
jgi:hypothetical protein